MSLRAEFAITSLHLRWSGLILYNDSILYITVLCSCKISSFNLREERKMEDDKRL